MNNNRDNNVVVAVPAHPPEPRHVQMTRRILIWAAVIAVAGVLALVLLDRPDYSSKTVPEGLVGEWTCDLPEYSDRYITLTPNGITFGTGGTSFVKYTVLGIEEVEVDGVATIVLHFRDVAGTTFERPVVVDPDGSWMHFASQPAVVWKRFGS